MPRSIVPVDEIIADSRCQSRTGIDLSLVQEYTDHIEAGEELPPVSTTKAPEGYYLYDGFHRIEALRQSGVREVEVEFEEGDIWDAIERSCRVNTTHGKRRTNTDKRRAVETMLTVMQHKGEDWTDSEIARRCAVSSNFVGTIRPHHSSDERYSRPRTVTRNGASYEMNTSDIGRKRSSTAVLDPGPDVDEDTGEILDDDPPEPEYVDTSDVNTFVDWTPMPSKQMGTPTTKPTVDYRAIAEREAARIKDLYGIGDGLNILERVFNILEEQYEP